MGTDLGGWTATFRGCEAGRNDCTAARFEVTSPQGDRSEVVVRTTAQIEEILARELGKPALEPREREAILSIAGRQLIEACLAKGGAVDAELCLDSRLLRAPGAERALLQASGLLRD